MTIRKMLILFSGLFLNISSLYSQVNTKLYPVLHKTFIGLNPQIYENQEDTIIKIYIEEYSIVDGISINKSFENAMSYDTISAANPLDKVITQNDKLIKLDDFEIIKLKEDTGEAYNVLFEKHVDFIGDASLDKIEITSSNTESDGKRAMVLKLYENYNNNLIPFQSSSALFWQKPLKLYVSKLRYLDMAVLIFQLESEIPEESMMLEMISSRKKEN